MDSCEQIVPWKRSTQYIQRSNYPWILTSPPYSHYRSNFVNSRIEKSRARILISHSRPFLLHFLLHFIRVEWGKRIDRIHHYRADQNEVFTVGPFGFFEWIFSIIFRTWFETFLGKNSALLKCNYQWAFHHFTFFSTVWKMICKAKLSFVNRFWKGMNLHVLPSIFQK